ncbi:MAG: pyridoxal 5'-phosphate synthase glutaminase subunit PdxT, partial [Acidobacteria bacterium]|nr:pyridoxal 5'-phosphate synthase glutaminase subunit PdxT [Acidobacteriota bacterium]
VFIRAPIIRRVGSGVRVLAACAGHPVLVRQDTLLASTFHPEMTSDPRVHRYFLDMIGPAGGGAARTGP